MNKNKFFFFLDLDGTTLDSEGKIRRKDIKFLKSIDNWAISTGRSINQSKFIWKKLRKANSIFENGAHTFFEKDIFVPIENDVLKTILKVWKWKIWDFSRGEQLLSEKNSVTKLSLYFDDLEEARKCITQIKGIRWNLYEDHFEVTSDKCSKGLAELMFSKLLDSNNIELIHIGDSENDLSVLECGITFICPSNASEEVKEKAHFVTKSTNESGIKKIIEEIYDWKKEIGKSLKQSAKWQKR